MTLLQSAILALLYGAPGKYRPLTVLLCKLTLDAEVERHFPGHSWLVREEAELDSLRRELSQCVWQRGGEA